MVSETGDVEVKVPIADEEVVHAWSNFVVDVHFNHPLYLYQSDNSCMSLIFIKLSGPKNYAMWSRVDYPSREEQTWVC